MALIKCKECGKEVSTKADKCPSCGAPIKRKSSHGCLIAIGVFFLIGVMVNLCDKNKSSTPSRSTPSPPKTQAELRKEQIEKCFSAWDGSHRNLTKFIKSSMNDPDSYDHVETGYSDKGDHLVVKTTFRGKNAFGGVVKNWVIAKVDLNCDVMEVLAKGP